MQNSNGVDAGAPDDAMTFWARGWEEGKNAFELAHWLWDVDAVKDLVRGREANARIRIASFYKDWAARGIANEDLEQAGRGDIDLNEPIIVVPFGWRGCAVDLLIDGRHRVLRANMEALDDLPAHVLTVEEAIGLQIRDAPWVDVSYGSTL